MLLNNQYELKYSSMFYEDFNKIIFYIKYELNNDIAANSLINLVECEIKKRQKNPISYEKYITNRNNIYYRIFIGNYTIFYTVTNYTMEVRRIIYNKRNFEMLL